MKQLKKWAAFTLLELLVVLTIIGILMAVGMATYSQVQNSAMKQSARLAMRQYGIAIANFKLDNGGRLPNDVKELLDGGYINKALATDPWKQEFRLEQTTTGTTKIISAGPDKQFGTKDDIIDEESI